MSEHKKITPGRYRGRALEAMLGETQKGTPYVRVKFAIVEPQSEFDTMTINWDGYFTDATKERSLKALLMCGWDGEDWDGWTDLGTKDVSLTVDYDKSDTDRKYIRVQFVNELYSSAPQTALDGGKKKSLAASLKGDILAAKKELAATAGQRPPRPAAKPTHAQNGGDDGSFDPIDPDDVPFLGLASSVGEMGARRRDGPCVISSSAENWMTGMSSLQMVLSSVAAEPSE